MKLCIFAVLTVGCQVILAMVEVKLLREGEDPDDKNYKNQHNYEITGNFNTPSIMDICIPEPKNEYAKIELLKYIRDFKNNDVIIVFKEKNTWKKLNLNGSLDSTSLELTSYFTVVETEFKNPKEEQRVPKWSFPIQFKIPMDNAEDYKVDLIARLPARGDSPSDEQFSKYRVTAVERGNELHIAIHKTDFLKTKEENMEATKKLLEYIRDFKEMGGSLIFKKNESTENWKSIQVQTWMSQHSEEVTKHLAKTSQTDYDFPIKFKLEDTTDAKIFDYDAIRFDCIMKIICKGMDPNKYLGRVQFRGQLNKSKVRFPFDSPIDQEEFNGLKENFMKFAKEFNDDFAKADHLYDVYLRYPTKEQQQANENLPTLRYMDWQMVEFSPFKKTILLDPLKHEDENALFTTTQVNSDDILPNSVFVMQNFNSFIRRRPNCSVQLLDQNKTTTERKAVVVFPEENGDKIVIDFRVIGRHGTTPLDFNGLKGSANLRLNWLAPQTKGEAAYTQPVSETIKLNEISTDNWRIIAFYCNRRTDLTSEQGVKATHHIFVLRFENLPLENETAEHRRFPRNEDELRKAISLQIPFRGVQTVQNPLSRYEMTVNDINFRTLALRWNSFEVLFIIEEIEPVATKQGIPPKSKYQILAPLSLRFEHLGVQAVRVLTGLDGQQTVKIYYQRTDNFPNDQKIPKIFLHLDDLLTEPISQLEPKKDPKKIADDDGKNITELLLLKSKSEYDQRILHTERYRTRFMAHLLLRFECVVLDSELAIKLRIPPILQGRISTAENITEQFKKEKNSTDILLYSGSINKIEFNPAQVVMVSIELDDITGKRYSIAQTLKNLNVRIITLHGKYIDKTGNPSNFVIEYSFNVQREFGPKGAELLTPFYVMMDFDETTGNGSARRALSPIYMSDYILQSKTRGAVQGYTLRPGTSKFFGDFMNRIRFALSRMVKCPFDSL